MFHFAGAIAWPGDSGKRASAELPGVGGSLWRPPRSSGGDHPGVPAQRADQPRPQRPGPKGWGKTGHSTSRRRMRMRMRMIVFLLLPGGGGYVLVEDCLQLQYAALCKTKMTRHRSPSGRGLRPSRVHPVAKATVRLLGPACLLLATQWGHTASNFWRHFPPIWFCACTKIVLPVGFITWTSVYWCSNSFFIAGYTKNDNTAVVE